MSILTLTNSLLEKLYEKYKNDQNGIENDSISLAYTLKQEKKDLKPHVRHIEKFFRENYNGLSEKTASTDRDELVRHYNLLLKLDAHTLAFRFLQDFLVVVAPPQQQEQEQQQEEQNPEDFLYAFKNK